MLFHLGVLRALRDHDGLLSRVRHIASVSGGSIIAAHVALNWSRYTGTEEQFDEAADELIAFARSDVRGSLIREWLFRHAAILPALLGWKRSRLTALFERKYRTLFG
ncbi:MAG TPA: patatin-like phospholipase family protein, partial [Thermoanaerobaculia bacterium]|nr:patatin-like phospholipase family protein [Thermoanaerobaculia bacterium]